MSTMLALCVNLVDLVKTKEHVNHALCVEEAKSDVVDVKESKRQVKNKDLMVIDCEEKYNSNKLKSFIGNETTRLILSSSLLCSSSQTTTLVASFTTWF